MLLAQNLRFSDSWHLTAAMLLLDCTVARLARMRECVRALHVWRRHLYSVAMLAALVRFLSLSFLFTKFEPNDISCNSGFIQATQWQYFSFWVFAKKSAIVVYIHWINVRNIILQTIFFFVGMSHYYISNHVWISVQWRVVFHSSTFEFKMQREKLWTGNESNKRCSLPLFFYFSIYFEFKSSFHNFLF